MELARNLAVQNKKQPLEACVVLTAVGCSALGPLGFGPLGFGLVDFGPLGLGLASLRQ